MGTLLRRVWYTIRRRRLEAELEEELEFHNSMKHRELESGGASAEDAGAAARRAMGNMTLAREESREVWTWAWLDQSAQDLRHATRSLVRTPGFALVAVLMLALGISANTAIFSVLRASSLRASAFPNPDDLMLVWSTPPNDPADNQSARVTEYFYWRDQNDVFADTGAMLGWSSTLGAIHDDESADRLNGWRFTATMFRALGVKPQLGRFFTADEDRVDSRNDIVVISDRLWRDRLAADPKVIGRTLFLDGTATTIVGVMPPGFRVFNNESDFWIPMPFSRFQVQARSPNRVLTVAARLKPGVSVEQAQARMNPVAAAFARVEPDHQTGRGVRVQPLDAALFGNVRETLRVLQGAVGFLLLIACANVAGLLLVRAASQHRQVVIRRSLGASRLRIVRYFLAQSVFLSVAGGALGTLLAWGALRMLVAAGPAWLSTAQGIEMDGAVLGFSVAVSVLTGLVFGLVPAIGSSASDLVTPLRDSGRIATLGRGHRRLQGGLLVAQVALALVLLVGAGLLVNSFWRLQRNQLGFEPRNVISFDTRLPANAYFRQVGVRDGFTQLDISPVPATLFDRVRERLLQVNGVELAAGANVPLVNGNSLPAPFTIEGRPLIDAAGALETLNANYALVTPNFFTTMRVPVRRGRDFTDRDTAGTLPVVIINETMARRFWPNENPIGKRLTVSIVTGERPREIVGVVGDTPVSRWDRQPAPALYVPHLQESLRSRTPYGQSRLQMTFVLRVNQPLDAIVPAVRRAVAEIDPSLPVSHMGTVDAALAQQIQMPRDSMLLLTMFSTIAVLLAAVGIYGIVAYGVVQRTKEIAIRMTLGAQRRRVLRLVLSQCTVLTVIGIILGVAGAAALTRYLETLLFELTPRDLATFIAVPGLFVLIAALASYLPARRATRLEPLVALRFE